MSVAYFIMLHKNFDQAHLLLDAIYHPDNVYIVHQDKKSLATAGVFATQRENVFVLEPQPVHWGGWSIVEVQLRAIAKALQVSPRWSHFVNLSGQCFPLRTQSAIMQFLSRQPDVNFMSFCDPGEPEVRQFVADRQKVQIVETELGASASEREKPPLNERIAQYHLGSGWFYLTRALCGYVSSSDPTIEQLRTYYRDALVPDESFFQTALMTDPEAHAVTYQFKRALAMDHDQQGGLHPKIYRMSDLEALMTSDALFARKFDPELDNEILQTLAYLVRE